MTQPISSNACLDYTPYYAEPEPDPELSLGQGGAGGVPANATNAGAQGAAGTATASPSLRQEGDLQCLDEGLKAARSCAAAYLASKVPAQSLVVPVLNCAVDAIALIQCLSEPQAKPRP